LILAGGIVLVFAGDYLLRRHRYGRFDQARRLYAEVSAGIRLLGVLGFRLREGETLTELRLRIEGAEEFSGMSLGFIPIFEAVRYGGRVVGLEELEAVIRDKMDILKVIKRERRLKYYWVAIQNFYPGISI
jgi:hypothetical protein